MLLIGIGLFIPFLGTMLGSAMVFFMKNKINHRIEKLLLGFASGVMIAASIWSLMMPSIEMDSSCHRISIGSSIFVSLRQFNSPFTFKK